MHEEVCKGDNKWLVLSISKRSGAWSVLVFLQVFWSEVDEHSIDTWRSHASLLIVIIQPCSPAFKGVENCSTLQSNKSNS